MNKVWISLFPVDFILFWLVITTVLSLFSGWWGLARTFPDRDEVPILRLRFQSGGMGLGVSYSNALKLSVCPSGLRVGMLRIFGPFCRDFLVPWNQIAVLRRNLLFLLPVAELQFGAGPIGKLTIFGGVADQLARAAQANWPEEGNFSVPDRRKIMVGCFRQWLLSTALVATFFTLAPRLLAHNSQAVPIPVAFLFPAVVFGIGALWRYLRESK